MSETLSATPADLQASWRDGATALRQGRPADALPHFRRIVDSGQANAAVWIGIALATKQLGDIPAHKEALAAALRLDPRDIRALLMTADNHAADGDARAASSYYDAVVKVAVAAGTVEKSMEAEVGRALHMREQYARAYAAHLDAELGPRGLDAPAGRRARKAVDLLTGRRELYLQQPKALYFPELPNIEWAERAAFPFLDKVEAATDAIRAELRQVLAEDSAFSPYVELEANRPFFDDHGMLGNPDWSAFYLWKAGAPVPENAARCPATMAALEEAPLCRIAGRTPSILFSLLRPGAHIQPHHGFMNARYVCHLPLIVPDGCAMRVGGETRPWVEGQACVFDDTIEHEAWNRHPDQLRVVLIFDIWRPELTAEERELVAAVLQAVDSYGGGDRVTVPDA
ncbi:aspartyl/asparaginyl beta-hydroxylase domain-containing protein [Phenylobacterium sp.]|jgi:aspartyl/asparaginyl beta-hydroxylase (cupin superfamily)|uniref:aspartyl/asparaginyl beta-hydroxylase domain-containing protein n=1 Tax=Phenylobacterium sp. TaxID=1871053 RepID=UPI002F92D4F9